MFWPKIFSDSVSRKKTRPAVDRAAKSVVTDVIHFQDQEILIRRKPYKRSIGLTIQVNGRIRVSAPLRTSLREIQDFLKLHIDWLATNSRRFSELRSSYPRKQYVEGEEFLFLGRKFKLHLMTSAIRKPRCRIVGEHLIVELPRVITSASAVDTESDSGSGVGETAAPNTAMVAAAIYEFYSAQGRKIIGGRLEYYSDLMKMWPSGVSFRAQKTRWGSCSSRGGISLNWRMVIAPLEVVDYVVVHELSHLQHYNHSARFWDLVATQVPDYLATRRWLRENQYETDFLAKNSELHA